MQAPVPSPAFSLFRPGRRDTPVIFSSPHGGKDYPAALLLRSPLDEHAIRSSEDACVDELFA
ncbi:MAG: N-formylglutamate amidohydrolase, partial [Rhodobacter sp.]|nr:N-formylglutamate amidohydrolase [Rhodobacter sp.]